MRGAASLDSRAVDPGTVVTYAWRERTAHCLACRNRMPSLCLARGAPVSPQRVILR